MKLKFQGKNVIYVFVLVVIVIFFFGGYYFYEKYFRQDQYNEFLSLGTKVQEVEGDTISVDLEIVDFIERNCKLKFCIMGDCNNSLSLPCEKLDKRSLYVGPGRYKVEIFFELVEFSVAIDPIKENIKQWNFEPLKPSPLLNKEDLLFGMENLLEKYYLWEISTIPVSQKNSTIADWFKSKEVSLNHDYLKSLLLLFELSEKLETDNFRNYFQREIEYLNLNKKEIIDTYNRRSPYPEAYILELVDLGLDEDYISLINEDIIGEDKLQEYIPDLGREPLLLSGKSSYTVEYLGIVYHSDNYRLFRKYSKEKLSNYSYNRMLEIYKNSEFVLHGLCSLSYANEDIVEPEKLRDKLEEVFSNSKKELIEENLYELLICDLYLRDNDMAIASLDERIREVVNLNVLEIEGMSFITRNLLAEEHNNPMGAIVITTYNLIDNLSYLLYELR